MGLEGETLSFLNSVLPLGSRNYFNTLPQLFKEENKRERGILTTHESCEFFFKEVVLMMELLDCETYQVTYFLLGDSWSLSVCIL